MQHSVQTVRGNISRSSIHRNHGDVSYREHTDSVVSELMSNGLSQLRLSYSRWHQQHINRENIVHAALSCQKLGLDYFISFVTDFSKKDDSFEQFLRDHHLKFFPEPVIYLIF